MLKHLIFILFISLFLSSCSTPTKSSKATIDGKTTNKPTAVLEESVSATVYLEKAQVAESEQAILLLIKAANQYIVESKYYQALWLANQTSALLTATQEQSSTIQEHYQLALIKSQALIAIDDYSRAFQQLNIAKEFANTAKLEHSTVYYQLTSQVETQRQNMIAALNAQLHTYETDSLKSVEDTWMFWHSFIQLPSWQMSQLNALNPPHFKGWLQLVNYANKFGSDSQQFSRYLKQWQRSYPTHPAQAIVPELLTENDTESTVIENIAVLLPLSGIQQSAGSAAQQGILAAYNNDISKTLHFIDTERLDMSTLSAKFLSLNIDYVIGPLLKSSVNNYLKQSDITIPTLLLNMSENRTLPAHSVALSMRPEDEAIQAATVLSTQNYHRPVILSHKDNVSRRIAKSFEQEWLKLTGVSPETVYFDSGAAMQNEVKSSLEVTQSNNRINELKSRIKHNLKVETRNRRDIDMIYLVGSPQDSRLVKPFIDVSISPFAKVIPVYASSRSHSATNDSSDIRDFTGLTFTEMPWFLPSKQQNKILANDARILWPERSVSLHRIFAMGYDSYSVIDKVALMKQSAYVRHYGQTGILRLDENNVLTRTLLWGRFRRDKVEEVNIN